MIMDGKLTLFDDLPLYEGVTDKIIDLKEEKFGHETYAKTILKIIEDNPKPMTIGLLGGWGTGKSSIMNILKNKINSNQKICVVLFNAWKHKGDSFRRQLLINVAKEIYGSESSEYTELIDLTGIKIKPKQDDFSENISYRQAFKEFKDLIFSKDKSAILIQFSILSILILFFIAYFASMLDKEIAEMIKLIIWLPLIPIIYSIVDKSQNFCFLLSYDSILKAF